jgi:hypothetical protein
MRESAGKGRCNISHSLDSYAGPARAVSRETTEWVASDAEIVAASCARATLPDRRPRPRDRKQARIREFVRSRAEFDGATDFAGLGRSRGA